MIVEMSKVQRGQRNSENLRKSINQNKQREKRESLEKDGLSKIVLDKLYKEERSMQKE